MDFEPDEDSELVQLCNSYFNSMCCFVVFFQCLYLYMHFFL